jgi:hypothetical protein
MTDTTISTDPATLRELAATLRMDEVRVCPHYLKLDLLADTYDAIAAEKEAQAAPGDLIELLARAIVRGNGAEIVASDAEWQQSVAHHQKMVAAHPSYSKGRGLVIDAFRNAEIALSAITAAGYEIRPRGEAPSELWAMLYLHDWDPDGKAYPEIHAVYRSWKEAEEARRSKIKPDGYHVRRVRFGGALPHDDPRKMQSIRPGESLGGGLVAVPEKYPTEAMQIAGETIAKKHILFDGDDGEPFLSRDGVIEVWAHMLAALTEKGDRS